MPRPEELPPSKTNEELLTEIEQIEISLELIIEQIKSLKDEFSKWFFKVPILIGVFAGLAVYAYYYRRLANNIKILKRLEKKVFKLKKDINAVKKGI